MISGLSGDYKYNRSPVSSNIPNFHAILKSWTLKKQSYSNPVWRLPPRRSPAVPGSDCRCILCAGCDGDAPEPSRSGRLSPRSVRCVPRRWRRRRRSCIRSTDSAVSSPTDGGTWRWDGPLLRTCLGRRGSCWSRRCIRKRGRCFRSRGSTTPPRI